MSKSSMILPVLNADVDMNECVVSLPNEFWAKSVFRNFLPYILFCLLFFLNCCLLRRSVHS